MSTLCSFCSKHKDKVKKLIRGIDTAYICNECVEQCTALLNTDNQTNFTIIDNLKITPKEIVKHLDEYVVGQEKAKKTLSVAVYQHYKRLSLYKTGNTNTALRKSNILMIGPTGCGKTLLAQTIAKFIKVPFAMADATTLTEAGYVGEDVESVIHKLLQNADGNIERAQYGIIYLDEVDKLARKAENASGTRDVSGQGVQEALLKLIEGTVANVSAGRKNPQQEQLQVDTSNILFICAGAFEGMNEILAHKNDAKLLKLDNTVDTTKIVKADYSQIETKDLIKYGLIPELVGRLSSIVTLDNPDKAMMMQILTEPKNSFIKQYQAYFQMDNIDLSFTQEALESIVDKALEKELGARGLHAVLQNLLLEYMYDLPGNTSIKRVKVMDKSVEVV